MSDRIITPMARLSFPTLVEPEAYEGGDEHYSTVLVFTADQKDELKPLRAKAIRALQEKFGDKVLKGKIRTKDMPEGKINFLVVPKEAGGGVYRLPWVDDAETVEEKGYDEGTTYMRVKSKRKPQVVNIYRDPETGKPMLVEDVAKEAYGGRNAVASLDVYVYDTKGNTGVTFMLGNIQLHPGGEPFGGDSIKAEDEFDATEDASELDALDELEGVDSADEPEVEADEPAPAEDDGEDLSDLIG